MTYFEPGSTSPYVRGMLMHEGSGLSLTSGDTEVELTDFIVKPANSARLVRVQRLDPRAYFSLTTLRLTFTMSQLWMTASKRGASSARPDQKRHHALFKIAPSAGAGR